MLRRMKPLRLLVLLSILSFPLSALSLTGSSPVQPFDSQKELARHDFTTPLTGELENWAEKTEISIIIMGPEKPLYSWFGHAAIVVWQPGGHGVMYDYGVFDTQQKGFYWNFIRGRMLYNIWATDADWRLELEMEGGRSVVEYRLDLPPQAKYQIMEFLKRNALEENNTYLYHFYKDNCATRLRDIIDAATGGDFQRWAKTQPVEGTYRSWAERYLGHSFFTSWMLNYLQGPEVDQPISLWEQMFLPDRLGDAIQEYAPLGAQRIVHQEQDRSVIPFTPSHTPVSNDIWSFLFGLLLAAITWLFWRNGWKGLGKAWNFLLLLVLGVCGTILCYAVCFSDLDVTWFNESLLVVNPLLFLPAFWVFHHPRRSGAFLRVMAIITLGLLILKGLFPDWLSQDSLKTLLLCLPVYTTGFFKDGSPARRSRKEAPAE